ncbi:MAG: DUF3298 domain-containing protein [Desulfovibrio sp.]|nr:DUF3298 domain-containing protein [Desulfovibrio sp.]
MAALAASFPCGALAATPRLLAAAPASPQGTDAARPATPEPAANAPTPEVAPAAASLPATPEDAAAQLSGSQWPGVINHLLQKPLPGSPADPQGAVIHIDYPSVGSPAVDADIRAWVTGIANAFEAHLDLSRPGLPEADMLPVHDVMESDSPTDQRPAFELWGSYSISRPSDAAVSITFEIWNYTGALQGNLDILTLNYSLLTGQRLAFMDLFEKPETALTLMSDWSRKELAPRLGATTRPAVLEAGTAPLVENFSSLTLTPEGVCINFQPYQVAPWAAGVQKVEMPLEALLPAGPLLALWGR